MSLKIKTVDKGYNKMVKTIEKGVKKKVDVGVLDAGRAYANGIRVADVAGWHEEGTETIPARSWLGAYIKENEAKNNDRIKKLAILVMQGKLTPEIALRQLGVLIVGEIQARISKGIEPALKPSTIKRKGSSKPLIDTGQLRTSIKSAVKDV